MSDIDKMVDRFLAWKLPSDFAPDGGVTFHPYSLANWPIGTNLLTAEQAKAMLEYVAADAIEARDKEIERLTREVERLMCHVRKSPALSSDYVRAAETEIDRLRAALAGTGEKP